MVLNDLKFIFREKLRDGGRTLVVDNHYISAELTHKSFRRNTYIIGTFHNVRKKYPNKIISKNFKWRETIM